MSEEIVHSTPVNPENKSNSFLLITLFTVFLLILGGAMLTLYAKEFAGVEPSSEIRYPIQGESITIDTASIIWREVQERDVAEDGVVIIPEVTLKLNQQSSGSLIAFFRDVEGATVGDPFRIDLSPEELASNQTTLTLTNTVGYKKHSDFRGYLFSEPPYWELVLKENFSEGTKEICVIPIPPTELKTK